MDENELPAGQTGDPARKRGRPAKATAPIGGATDQGDGVGNEPNVAPGGVDGGPESAARSPEAETAEAPRARRGRPPGSGKARVEAPGTEAKAPTALDPRQVAAQIKGMHAFVATMTQEELFLLTDAQAMMFGGAIAEASKHFDFAPSGKIMSLMQLATVAAIIYVPMFGAINQKRRATRPISPIMAATPDDVHATPNGTYDFSTVQ